jgi:pimeloyl-ACP methyl ester carboxylesterase
MEMKPVISTDTPLKTVPDDYWPSECARWFEIPSGHDAGKNMFYYDYTGGPGPTQSTVLFVHGNPECSYTYRFIRDALIQSGAPLRLVAMDHIGFGVSDQASFEMVDMHHAANLAQLIRHLDLHNVTLVVHDWGGPIGIGAFVDEPDRVERLVVINTGIFPIPQDHITYTNWPWRWMPWSRLPHVVPDSVWGGAAACAVLNANPGSLLKLYLKSFKYQILFSLGKIPPKTPASVYSEPLRSKANARSSKRNVLQTPVWGCGYSYTDPVIGKQDNHAFYEKMQETVPEAWGPQGANIPVAGHFGSWDPMGKDSVIRQWQEALPQMKQHTHIYPDHGHFVEEYKGAEIAASILELNGISA